MVLFFIADLALTLAFKIGTWCLGKTYNGIVYLVTYKTTTPTPTPTPTPKTNAHEAMNDSGDCTDDCVIITMTRQEYDALKRELHQQHHHASSSSSSEDVSSEVGSSSK